MLNNINSYNVISNCCLGGYLYKTQNILYQNPFIWTAVLTDSMKFLLASFDKINWQNIELRKCDWIKYANTPRYSIVVDNKIKIHYTHYIKDEKCDSPIINDVDVFYKDIEKYIIEKYMSRLKRMSNNPAFVILDEIPYYDYSKENVSELLKIQSQSKLIIITKHKEFLKENNNRILCIYDDTNRCDECHCPIYYTKYVNEINNFIHLK